MNTNYETKEEIIEEILVSLYQFNRYYLGPSEKKIETEYRLIKLHELLVNFETEFKQRNRISSELFGINLPRIK